MTPKTPAPKSRTHGSWKPGQSGNPFGRPKEYREVVALAREKTPLAIATLATIMSNSLNDSARVRAAELIIERGWGKAIQPVTANLDDDALDPRQLATLTDSELLAIIVRRRTRVIAHATEG